MIQYKTDINEPIKNSEIFFRFYQSYFSALLNDLKNETISSKFVLIKFYSKNNINELCEAVSVEFKLLHSLSNAKYYKGVIENYFAKIQKLRSALKLFKNEFTSEQSNLIEKFKVTCEHLDIRNDLISKVFNNLETQERFFNIIDDWENKTNLRFSYIYNHLEGEKNITSKTNYESFIRKKFGHDIQFNYLLAKSEKNYDQLKGY